MKSIEDFAAALVDAVKGARDLEQQRKDAQQAIARAQAEAESIRTAARKERDDARVLIAEDKAAAAKRLAELEDRQSKALAAEKAEHTAYVSNARAQVDQASQTLIGLQNEIAEARRVRETLNAENAKLVAAFGEAGKRLAGG